MITKEQYLEAIEICEKYLEQEKERVDNLKSNFVSRDKRTTFEDWANLKKGDKIKVLNHNKNSNTKLKIGDVLKVTHTKVRMARRNRRLKEFAIDMIDIGSKRKYCMTAEFNPDINDDWFFPYWSFEKFNQ